VTVYELLQIIQSYPISAEERLQLFGLAVLLLASLTYIVVSARSDRH
jgi:hypothetical protein